MSARGRNDLPNFRDLSEAACIRLWGDPDKRDCRELRWNGCDAYRAKTFNLKKRAWYDHGEQRGGGLLDLVAYSKGQPKQELRGKAFFEVWAEAYEMGLVPVPPPKSNGAAGPILTTYPYHDESGALLFEVVRFDTAVHNKRFSQRRPDGAGGWIWDVKGVRTHVLYRLPATLDALKAGQRVLITEGERDANSAVSFGFAATTNPGGVNKWRAEYDKLFRDADVVVVSDNDPQAKDPKTGAPQFHPDGRPVHVGQDHAAKLAKRLCKVVAHVRVIIFEQKDLSAWKEAGGDRAALVALIDAAPDLVKQPPLEPEPDPGPDPDGKPRLRVEASHPDRVVMALRDILAGSGRLYDRDTPVRVALDHAFGGTKAHALSPDDMVLETHFACQPFAMVKRKDGVWEEQPVQLPLNVARMYLGWHGEWRLPPLNGVTTAPILSEDGGIRTTCGYDPATGLWCENIPDVAELVPLRPKKASAEAALALVRGFFKTFCFADAETVAANGVDVVDLQKPPSLDESSFLASLLGSVCRASLWLAPGYLFRGASHSGSGAGKGKLARCVCAVAYGRQPFAIAPGGNAEEFEKRIAAALLEGGPAVLFDNLNGVTLRSASLESALSERPAKVRQFRTLELIQLNALASTFVTGNGITLSRDLVRRFVETELDARMEDPEQRRFSGDIVAEALSRRRDLLAALLTIWRYGRLDSLKQGVALGSYEQWCAWVRDPLITLGCQDPIERLSEAKERDPFRRTVAELFTVWWRLHGSSPQTAYGLDPEVQKIVDPHGRGRQFVVGQLEKYAGTRLAGFKLTRHKGLNPREAATYKLEETGDGQTPGPTHGTHGWDAACGQTNIGAGADASESAGASAYASSDSISHARANNPIQHTIHAYHAGGVWNAPPDVIVDAARWSGVIFHLAPEGDVFTPEWRGPVDPLVSEAIRWDPQRAASRGRPPMTQFTAAALSRAHHKTETNPMSHGTFDACAARLVAAGLSLSAPLKAAMAGEFQPLSLDTCETWPKWASERGSTPDQIATLTRTIRGLVKHPGYLGAVATDLSERVDIDGNVFEKVAREDHLTADLIQLQRGLKLAEGRRRSWRRVQGSQPLEPQRPPQAAACASRRTTTAGVWAGDLPEDIFKRLWERLEGAANGRI
jgi:hypothetical protein